MKRIALAILIIVCTIATGASVAYADPYTKDEMKHDSLRAKDVPDDFFVNQPKQRALAYAQAPDTNQFEMCVDKDGNKVFGTAPAAHTNSSVPLNQQGTGDDVSVEWAVSSDVYSYKGKNSAQQAWDDLVKANKRCAPAAGTSVPIGTTDSVNVAVSQRIWKTKTNNGHPGFTNEQHIAVIIAENDPEGLKLWVGGFTAYRFVGKAIVRVQFANYTTVSQRAAALKPEWLTFVRQEANTIANRVASN